MVMKIKYKIKDIKQKRKY